MKYALFTVALVMTLGLAACEKTVVTQPGPAGATGATGSTGSTGAAGAVGATGTESKPAETPAK